MELFLWISYAFHSFRFGRLKLPVKQKLRINNVCMILPKNNDIFWSFVAISQAINSCRLDLFGVADDRGDNYIRHNPVKHIINGIVEMGKTDYSTLPCENNKHTYKSQTESFIKASQAVAFLLRKWVIY